MVTNKMDAKLNKGKILIADDENLLRFTLLQLLEMEGWEVIEAINGEDALQKIIQYKPDIAIVDIRMPKLNGLEVHKQVVTQKLTTQLILSSGGMNVEKLALDNGFKFFLQKPYDVKDLTGMLDSILRMRNDISDRRGEDA